MSQMLVVGSRWCVWKWGWRCQGDLGRTPRASAILPYSKSECICARNPLLASISSYSFYTFLIENSPFHLKVLSTLLISVPHHIRSSTSFAFMIRQHTQFSFWHLLSCSFYLWSILQSFTIIHALLAMWSFIMENIVDVLIFSRSITYFLQVIPFKGCAHTRIVMP